MNELIEFVKSVGFPIAVAIYLLWRYEQRFIKVTDTLVKIGETLAVIKDRICDEGGDNK
jgi:hypothetical protein